MCSFQCKLFCFASSKYVSSIYKMFCVAFVEAGFSGSREILLLCLFHVHIQLNFKSRPVNCLYSKR